MRCDMCQQESETCKYDIHGMVIDMCQECFVELQLEVVSIEGLDKAYYIQVFKKLGIVPKTKCTVCMEGITGQKYVVGNKPLCEECFDNLNNFFL